MGYPLFPNSLFILVVHLTGVYTSVSFHIVFFLYQFMPIVVVMFAMGAAMGQFGCYAYDGALKLSFSKLSNKTGVMIPTGIDVLFNILRATSLFHIFYGFCLLLVFHLSLIFMIQSSMREFNGKRDCSRSK